MDLSGLKFGVADARGFCEAVATDSDGLANLQLLRLTPGVKLLDVNRALVPANVPGVMAPLARPAEATAPSGLKLRRYQLEAIEFMERAPLGAINGCDVGLGKTATALAVLHRHPEWRPFVVVADDAFDLGPTESLRSFDTMEPVDDLHTA